MLLKNFYPLEVNATILDEFSLSKCFADCKNIVCLCIATPRQNTLSMSTDLSFWSIMHFTLLIKIQGKQGKIPYREV